MASTIIFYCLAAIILICALLAVTTKRIMRAATYLLFVLFGTAGLYFLMGYTFLGAVQVMVYAGGVVVLYIFALMLTGRKDVKDNEKASIAKKMAAVCASLGAAAILQVHQRRRTALRSGRAHGRAGHVNHTNRPDDGRRRTQRLPAAL